MGTVLVRFYARRALRIFPAYYTVVLIWIYFSAAPYAGAHLLYVFNLKLFLLSLHGKLASHFAEWRSSGIHLWSLDVEEQFYLFFPVVLLLFRKSYQRTLLWFLLVLSIATRLAISFWRPKSFYGLLLPISGEFMLWGALAACYQQRKAWNIRVAAWGQWLCLGVLVSLILLGHPSPSAGVQQFCPGVFQTPLGILFAVLIRSLWCNGDSLLGQVLSWPPFVYLGKISYGLYLIHLFSWDLQKAFGLGAFPSLPTTFLITVGLAMVSWHLLESPILKFKYHFPLGIGGHRQSR